MKNFKVQEINDRIINKYLDYKNLLINRKYSSHKKLIRKIDHYQWWFKKQKKRKSLLIFKENKLIYISTADHFKFKNYSLVHSGLISCLPETNLFDLLKAIKIQNEFLNKLKNKYCFITVDLNNKVLMHHWKYFGYSLLKRKNIFYNYVKKFLKVGKNYKIFYRKV